MLELGSEAEAQVVVGQIAYLVLVILMGTAWGVISLWAAASSLHSALRLIVVAALLAFFLSVPAYEPILFFALQSIVIAAGVVVGRQLVDETQSLRFSLKSLLVTTVVASLLLATAVRTNIPSWWTWLALVSGSVSLGVATLFAVWTIRPWRRTKIFVGLASLLGASIPMGLCDSMVVQFPAWDRGVAAPTLFGSVSVTQVQLSIAATCVWFTVLVATYAIQTLVLALATMTQTNDDSHKKKLFGQVGVVTLLALIVTPIVWLYLSIPQAIPDRVAAAGTNGYDVLQGLRKHFIGGGVLDDPKPATDAQLKAALKKNDKAFAMFREMKDLPFEPPEKWRINQMLLDAQLLREMARALMADSELAQRQGRLDDVVTNSLDLIQVSHRTNSSSLMVGLVSVAVEASAQHPLGLARDKLDSEQRLAAIEGLAKIDATAATLDEMQAGEDAWAQRMYGWRIQVYSVLSEAFGGIDELVAINAAASKEARSRITVGRRLLMIVFALKEYQEEAGALPKSLSELGLDPSALIDEFDGKPIRYEPGPDSFKLYSVGPDGIDDGGVPTELPWMGKGDLLVESVFPDPSSAQQQMGVGPESAP